MRNDGTYTLTVTFKPGIDLNIAQVLVQNRVNLAQPVLPDLVKRRGVTVKKKSPSQLMIINLSNTGATPERRGASEDAPRIEQLRHDSTARRTRPTGRVSATSPTSASAITRMRLWLDPEKLRRDEARGRAMLSTRSSSRTPRWPPARSASRRRRKGRRSSTRSTPSADSNRRRQFAGNDPEVRSGRQPRRATEGRGAQSSSARSSYDQSCTLDGKPSVALSVYQLPGTNAIETARRVRSQDGGIASAVPGERRLRHRLRHDAVHPGVDRRGVQDAARRRDPGRHRHARVPAVVAGGDHSRWRRCPWPSSAPSRRWPRSATR